MKKYLLLRDNKESGPYSLEEIKELQLKPLDLIWIDGRSTAWAYTTEINELKEHVTEEAFPEIKSSLPVKGKKVFVSLPSNFNSKQRHVEEETLYSLPVHESEPVLETNYVQKIEELKEQYELRKAEPKELWSKKMLPSGNVLNLAAAFFGLIISVFIVKKIVDGFGETATLPGTETSVASTIIEEPVTDETYQNALVTEVLPPKAEVVKPVVKAAKPKDIKKQVSVRSNDYKVGLFGGIDNLQLTVNNKSAHFVDQVEVEVNYLKPNGKVVGTETYKVKGLRPFASRTISVPASDRGVKVNYKILNIYSQQYKNLLKNI